MIVLRNLATGHEVKTDEESSDFWLAAGYRSEKPKAPAKKPAPRKSSK